MGTTLARDLKEGKYYFALLNSISNNKCYYIFSNITSKNNKIAATGYYYIYGGWFGLPEQLYDPTFAFSIEECGSGDAPPTEPPDFKASAKPVNLGSASTGKRIIPENKNSTTCVQCHHYNKEIVLFRTTTFYCPNCEP